MEVSNITYNLHNMWENENVRELVRTAIVNGDFKKYPKIATSMVNILNCLEKYVMDDDQMFNRLRAVICQHPEFKLEWEHKVQKRLSQVSNLIDLSDEGFEGYLDFGCGNGRITEAISNSLSDYALFKIGIDPANYIEDNESFIFYRYNEQELPFDDGTFDLVTCFTVMHHSKNPVHDLKELHRVMSLGGTLVFREFDALEEHDKMFNRFMDELLYKVYYNLDDVNIQDHYYSKESWVRLLRQIGFRNVKIHTFEDEKANPYKPFMVTANK